MKIGESARVEYGGETFSGRAWMDKCERMARQGYFAPVGSDARRRGRDFLYYLWREPAVAHFRAGPHGVF